MTVPLTDADLAAIEARIAWCNKKWGTDDALDALMDRRALLAEVRELRRVLGVIQHRAHTGRRGPLLDLNEIGHLALRALGVTTTGAPPAP